MLTWNPLDQEESNTGPATKAIVTQPPRREPCTCGWRVWTTVRVDQVAARGVQDGAGVGEVGALPWVCGSPGGVVRGTHGLVFEGGHVPI